MVYIFSVLSNLLYRVMVLGLGVCGCTVLTLGGKFRLRVLGDYGLAVPVST